MRSCCIVCNVDFTCDCPHLRNQVLRLRHHELPVFHVLASGIVLVWREIDLACLVFLCLIQTNVSVILLTPVPRCLASSIRRRSLVVGSCASVPDADLFCSANAMRSVAKLLDSSLSLKSPIMSRIPSMNSVRMQYVNGLFYEPSSIVRLFCSVPLSSFVSVIAATGRENAHRGKSICQPHSQ